MPGAALYYWVVILALVGSSTSTSSSSSSNNTYGGNLLDSLQRETRPTDSAPARKQQLRAHRQLIDPTAHLNPDVEAFQATPQQVLEPTIPDLLRAKGFKGLAPVRLRNWRQLAYKLDTPGSNITVVAFGGSITAGYIEASPNSSWVDPLMATIQASYPALNFTVLNLARGGVDVTPAALCWYQQAPQDADLVLIEYSVNGCVGNIFCHNFASPRIAAYETLVRRLLLRAPSAALLAVAAFNFWNGVPLARQQKFSAGVSLPNSYYGSGEVHETVIAHRYGIPVASIRDALYDVMFDDRLLKAATGMTRSQLLSRDPVHPSTAGHVLYAAIIEYTLQRTLASVSQQPPSLSARQALPLPLPPPVSPLAAQEADGVPFCAESASLQQFVTSSSGWSWGIQQQMACPHPNCQTSGYYAPEANRTLLLTIDTQSSTLAINGAVLESRDLVVIYASSLLARLAGKIGVAQLACVRGCRCKRVLLRQPDSSLRGGNLVIAKIKVTPHPQCVVRITSLGSMGEATGQGFYLNGVAVLQFTKSKPLSPLDREMFAVDRQMWPSSQDW